MSSFLKVRISRKFENEGFVMFEKETISNNSRDKNFPGSCVILGLSRRFMGFLRQFLWSGKISNQGIRIENFPGSHRREIPGMLLYYPILTGKDFSGKLTIREIVIYQKGGKIISGKWTAILWRIHRNFRRPSEMLIKLKILENKGKPPERNTDWPTSYLKWNSLGLHF